MWKSTFVKSGAVVRPENGNDTVSEGIAYGMLIAVNMNDKTLFDSLYSYWSGHSTAGSLMTWCIPGGSGSCSASGGSATDADEDAAFALLQADKVFGGGSYKSEAMTMIGDIWTHDIDGGGTNLPKGGSNYGSPSSAVTNASYFAPAYYSAFKAAGDTNDWDSVNTAVYKAIGAIAGSDGLIPRLVHQQLHLSWLQRSRHRRGLPVRLTPYPDAHWPRLLLEWDGGRPELHQAHSQLPCLPRSGRHWLHTRHVHPERGRGLGHGAQLRLDPGHGRGGRHGRGQPVLLECRLPVGLRLGDARYLGPDRRIG